MGLGLIPCTWRLSERACASVCKHLHVQGTLVPQVCTDVAVSASHLGWVFVEQPHENPWSRPFHLHVHLCNE